MSATTGGTNTQKSSKPSTNEYVSASGGDIEVPPGMRFIPTPGTNLESAIYALAIVLRPRKHSFLLELVKLGKTALDITAIIRDGTTNEEKDTFTTKWQERLQQQLKADAKQNGFKTAGEKGEEEAKQSESEDVKQEQNKSHKQEQDKGIKQERDEGAKLKQDKDIRQREREGAQAIAAEYAVQDRYDSCSDSD